VELVEGKDEEGASRLMERNTVAWRVLLRHVDRIIWRSTGLPTLCPNLLLKKTNIIIPCDANCIYNILKRRIRLNCVQKLKYNFSTVRVHCKVHLGK